LQIATSEFFDYFTPEFPLLMFPFLSDTPGENLLQCLKHIALGLLILR